MSGMTAKGTGLNAEQLEVIRAYLYGQLGEMAHDRRWRVIWDDLAPLGGVGKALLAEVLSLREDNQRLRTEMEGIANLAHDAITGNGGYMPHSSVFAAINTRAVTALTPPEEVER